MLHISKAMGPGLFGGPQEDFELLLTVAAADLKAGKGVFGRIQIPGAGFGFARAVDGEGHAPVAAQGIRARESAADISAERAAGS